ncbi:hypothetical protein SDC9_114299 [bioreactor metagenome]|uniref:Uncharacterized protein n=1 Tax=bioreactor metagenome TaxID=1076179 RepID=A0A645BQ47_9ZZZZ
MDCGYPKVDHHFKLPGSISCCCGDDHGSHPFNAVVEAEPACKEAVIHGVLDNVTFRKPYHRKAAGNHVRPGLYVFCSITNNCWLSTGS